MDTIRGGSTEDCDLSAEISSYCLNVPNAVYGHAYRNIYNSLICRFGTPSLSDGVANNNIENLGAVFAKIKGGGITDLDIGPDGLLYIVSSNGKITRLESMETNATLQLIDTNATQLLRW